MGKARSAFVCLLGLFSACGDSSHPPFVAPDGALLAPDAGPSEMLPVPPPGCAPEDGQNPPDRLECTGLYTDFAGKLLAPGVREFAPAYPLWSDGAEKTRWISLPAGTTIDTTAPAEWSFPIGTKAWKEFRRGGRRVETRLFYKVRSDKWLWATYVWKDGDTRTERSFGETLTLPDGPYSVPLDIECNDCHKGRKDKLLGFEAPLLGMPGAQGVTLATLAAEGRLSPPPARTSYQIPDDGTGVAAPALGWLHVNCGVSCHNENPNATGYPTGMFLRIDADALSGAPLSSWRAISTTVNRASEVVNFFGQTRIVPGSPEQSLLVKLSGIRGTNQQMPPIATRVVDVAGLSALQEWVWRLGTSAQPPLSDGGSDDAGSSDAGTSDAGEGVADAQAADTGDAGASDADAGEVADAGAPML